MLAKMDCPAASALLNSWSYPDELHAYLQRACLLESFVLIEVFPGFSLDLGLQRLGDLYITVTEGYLMDDNLRSRTIC